MAELDRALEAEDHRSTASPMLELSEADLEPPPISASALQRIGWSLAAVLTLVLIAVLPPLVNFNRYQREVASSIGASLGRPVHIDSVSLTLLPRPGFTLGNFVVGEDPAFGAEPVIRAASVRASLRVGSLWRRRLEFSRISLTDPSVNLVHLPDGRWNVESILLQASRITAAPTAQRGAGSTPRFPYIEATGARLNVKMGLEKMPFALTEAEFALWLSEPDRWRLRLEAHPTRTDTAVTDTGTVTLEGSLGRAARLAQVPIDLTGTWKNAPLGAVSWILLGRDAGLRGEGRLDVSATGSVGDNTVTSRLRLTRLRRADFVPTQPLSLDLLCHAQTQNNFHSAHSVACALPAARSDDPAAPGLSLDANVPDVLTPATSTGTLRATAIPAAALLTVLRTLTPRCAPSLTATGTFTGALAWSGGRLREGTLSAPRLVLADSDAAGQPSFLDAPIDAVVQEGVLSSGPLPLSLGATSPAVLNARADSTGYTLTLAGPVLPARVLQLAGDLPQFGDGIETLLPTSAPALPETPDGTKTAVRPATTVRLDATGHRPWSGGLVWSTLPPPRLSRGTRRHR